VNDIRLKKQYIIVTGITFIDMFYIFNRVDFERTMFIDGNRIEAIGYNTFHVYNITNLYTTTLCAFKLITNDKQKQEVIEDIMRLNKTQLKKYFTAESVRRILKAKGDGTWDQLNMIIG